MTGQRVLMVEDDRHILRALAPALSVSGYRVTAVATVASALEQIAACAWKAAVVDLGLPDGEGGELIEPLRAAGVPVVVITARPDPPARASALGRGATAFLRKPFATPELVQIIDDLPTRTAV